MQQYPQMLLVQLEIQPTPVEVDAWRSLAASAGSGPRIGAAG